MDDVFDEREDRLASGPRLGTRFLIYPQPPFIPGYERPELVWISVPPNLIRPGPSDARMYVVSPLVEKPPFEFPYLPPYLGPRKPAAEAAPDGHWDTIPTDAPEFLSVHSYACIRRVLDICESYWGAEIPWFFTPVYDRLEITPHLRWDNAQSGFGFLELGEDTASGRPEPFALNFDAIAHETGHLILFGTMGVPDGDPPHQYWAFQEAAADFVALLSLLHFDTALDLILRRTRGNLLISNELDRLAELTDEKQIRRFSQSLKLDDVGQQVHDLSKPFAGALFDVLIDIYHSIAFDRGLSDLDLRAVSDIRRDRSLSDVDRVLSEPLTSYGTRHFAIKSALEDARNIVAETFVRSWRYMDPDTLDYRTAANAIIRAADEGRGHNFVDFYVDDFAWRGIL